MISWSFSSLIFLFFIIFFAFSWSPSTIRRGLRFSGILSSFSWFPLGFGSILFLLFRALSRKGCDLNTLWLEDPHSDIIRGFSIFSASSPLSVFKPSNLWLKTLICFKLNFFNDYLEGLSSICFLELGVVDPSLETSRLLYYLTSFSNLGLSFYSC